jgi:hypothetical protein
MMLIIGGQTYDEGDLLPAGETRFPCPRRDGVHLAQVGAVAGMDNLALGPYIGAGLGGAGGASGDGAR